LVTINRSRKLEEQEKEKDSHIGDTQPRDDQHSINCKEEIFKMKFAWFVFLFSSTLATITVFPEGKSRASEISARELSKILENELFRYGSEELRVDVDGCRIIITRKNDNCYYKENTKEIKKEICLREFESIKVFKNNHSSSINFKPNIKTRKKIESLNLTSQGRDEKFGFLCPTKDKLFTKTTNSQCNGEKYFEVDPGGALIRLRLGSEKVVEEKLSYYLNSICSGN
jgi:hypothetical protein